MTPRDGYTCEWVECLHAPAPIDDILLYLATGEGGDELLDAAAPGRACRPTARAAGAA